MACFAAPLGLRYTANCFIRADAQNSRQALIPAGGKLRTTSAHGQLKLTPKNAVASMSHTSGWGTISHDDDVCVFHHIGANRPWMIARASVMILSISSAQVGMSWIKPCAILAQ
jgi:hypothetical protein